MKDKQFCGNGKPFGQYGGFKLGIEASKLPPPNEKGYINLIMSPTKNDPNKFYIAVDDWKPNTQGEFKAGAAETRDENNVLPF
jgi:hypothetical protein